MTITDLSPAAAAVLTPAAWAAMNRSPVLLGWPVLRGCTASRHNTLRAARTPGTGKCTCPHALELRREHTRKDKEARAAKAAARLAAMTPEQREQAERQRLETRRANLRAANARRVAVERTAEEVRPALPPVGRPGEHPQAECRVAALGGRLTIWQAEEHYDETSGQSGEFARASAKARCRRCPVQRACLERAVETGEAFGIWGGLTPQERRNPRLVAAELRAIPLEVEA